MFDKATGAPWRLEHYCRFLRETLGGCLEELVLTSYSLRRFMPTFADAVQLPGWERVFGGGWAVSKAAGQTAGGNT